MSIIQYKVVELNIVTDELIEEALNLWTQQGWHFDTIKFVVREASKRPSMAFVLFTRESDSSSSSFCPDLLKDPTNSILEP